VERSARAWHDAPVARPCAAREVPPGYGLGQLVCRRGTVRLRLSACHRRRCQRVCGCWCRQRDVGTADSHPSPAFPQISSATTTIRSIASSILRTHSITYTWRHRRRLTRSRYRPSKLDKMPQRAVDPGWEELRRTSRDLDGRAQRGAVVHA